METRFLRRALRRIRLSPSIRRFHNNHPLKDREPSNHQTNPIGDYYASLLESSTPKITSKPPTTATPSADPPIVIGEEKAPEAPEAAILFSSRLSSPLERRSEIRKKSTLLAGVWVPQKPDEPDNCCMSGCVNCVWDRYGEELQEWAVARKEAYRALKTEGSLKGDMNRRKNMVGLGGTGSMLGEEEKAATHTMVSMDDDGGGSETNWDTGSDTTLEGEDLFKGIPVGIREFMKQEKRLREKHTKEKTTG
ncbi:putative UPF0651 protein, mitochondrial [Amylocarpus encephaloides]|uniref:UPF0651 protein, mitochondrial n=1 Tax=Amylocarpus encephaloides TaxID=45428 RepID=A0A9P7YQ72_9HELO|nr:putative UPF0651 protein, mitochondrial [Amylocarpus encephaloides]